MRMLLYVTVLLVAAVGIAYSQGPEDYWPMDVGYYWIQHTDSFGGGYLPSTNTYDVEGTDSILGEEYFRMTQLLKTDGDSLLTGWCVWVGADTSGLVWVAWSITDNIDSAIIFSTPARVLPNGALNQGYTWEDTIPEMNWVKRCSTQSITETVVVPAGTFNDCIQIHSILSWIASGDTFQTTDSYYAEGVGEVLNDGWEEWSGGFRWELIEYNVGVDEKKTRAATPRFSLQQNYPNPFGSVTTISYLLPNSEHVSIKVYNVAGVEVATLVDEYRTPGKYSVKWDGAGLSSGIYLTRIVAGNYTETKTAIVLR